jgi:DNA-binding NarL/FixJ family response regulator
MAEAKTLDRNPKAIICLEGSLKIWRLLKRSLDSDEEPSGFIFAQAPDTPTEILTLCRRLVPAMVVIEDIRIQTLPLKQLRDLIGRRDIQILVFSDTTDSASFEHFFRMGCTGVLPYKVTPQMLRKAVLAVCEGELWLPRKVLSKLAQDSFVKGTTRKMTQRESEIFKLISLGFTNQQIAEHLFISRETVRWHLRSLYSKIGVDSRSGAIRYAKLGSETAETTPSEPPLQ